MLKFLFDSNEREIRKLRPIVEKINSLEPQIASLTDAQLRAKTDEFRERLRKGETLDDILVEAFAVVREAAKRAIGLRHFDVQLMGGIVLHQGRIAEMKTGEGKTLVATLPAYLNALEGKGVHIVTVNDYLAKRDTQWMGPVYHFLGLTVGCIQHESAFIFDPTYPQEEERLKNLRPASKREAYACDITYATNSELGFDYLRDNLVTSVDEIVLLWRELNYAIIDEVDCILIDEARTPHIIAGPIEEDTSLYYRVDRAVAGLKEEIDFTVDEKAKNVMLTEEGVRKVEANLGISNLSDIENVEIMRAVNAALRARFAYKRDVDYVVKDGEVVIVDEFTGRLMFGRRYSDGLHQAIEAKERVRVQQESQTIAVTSFQNLFRLYKKLAGMTGTAKTEEAEFRKIYGLDVVVIPTHKPMIRKDLPDRVYKTQEAKYRGIVEEIIQRHHKGQPLLVGTRSIEVSEKLSARLSPLYLQMLALAKLALNEIKARRSQKKDDQKLEEFWKTLLTPLEQLSLSKVQSIAKQLGLEADPLSEVNLRTLAQLLDLENKDDIAKLREILKEGIKHQVLNAKYHEKEAAIIAQAGKYGMVTIATNMAGRGVDILLGGNPEGLAISFLQQEGLNPATVSPEEYQRALQKAKEICEKERELVLAAGGLHIIGTERHESRRIDNQLRGRAGRQGDPGSSRFYVSLEDELWRLFGEKGGFLLSGWPDDEPIESPLLSKALERAQKRVEGWHFSIRKQLLEYDDVMNIQREVIYRERRKILEGNDMRPNILEFMRNLAERYVEIHCPKGVPSEEWDIKGLYESLTYIFPIALYLEEKDLRGKRKEELVSLIYETMLKAYEQKESIVGQETMRQVERLIMLRVIDSQWMEHLNAMEYLKEGIGLRAYAQTDPLVAYKTEAFAMFQEMRQRIEENTVKYIFWVQISGEPRQGLTARRRSTPVSTSHTNSEQPAKRKVGRNDPCPCGSGKKYKKCCMLKDMMKEKEKQRM
ncbi:preprotein translocase subunit SecA [bacterium]|nr:preprotein translocase subunit SecA [bacterium]